MPLVEVITAVVSILFGSAGGGGIMYWYLKKQRQEHVEKIDIADRFENRLDRVEHKLEETEDEVDKLKKRENKLVYQINVLIDRIEMLVSKLDGYDELSDEEKEHLTNLPTFHKERPEANES